MRPSTPIQLTAATRLLRLLVVTDDTSRPSRGRLGPDMQGHVLFFSVNQRCMVFFRGFEFARSTHVHIAMLKSAGGQRRCAKQGQASTRGNMASAPEPEKHETERTCTNRVFHKCHQCHLYLLVANTTCVSTSHCHSFPCLSSGCALGASARERSAHCFHMDTATACDPTRSVIMPTKCKRAHVLTCVHVPQGTSTIRLKKCEGKAMRHLKPWRRLHQPSSKLIRFRGCHDVFACMSSGM